MGNLQKKRRTTGKKALAYRGKSGGQNTGNDFLALGLGVVVYLPNYYIPLFMFWGIILGNNYRKLYSIIFLGELITVV